VKRLLAVASIALAAGCASLIGIGDLTVEDGGADAVAPDSAAPDSAAPDSTAPEGGGCGWPGPAAGLVGYWAYEEQSGKSTADCSDGGHPATTYKAGWDDAGYLGGAMHIALDSQSVVYGCFELSKSAPVPPSSFSLSAFIRLDTTVSGSARWVAGRSNGPSIGWGVIVAPDGTSLSLKIFNALSDGGDYGPSIAGSWLDGAWHHVVATVPADGGATIAIDDASVTDPDPAPAIHVDTNDGVSLGCRGDGIYALIGVLDEVRIYDHVLDAGEIADLSK